MRALTLAAAIAMTIFSCRPVNNAASTKSALAEEGLLDGRVYIKHSNDSSYIAVHQLAGAMSRLAAICRADTQATDEQSEVCFNVDFEEVLKLDEFQLYKSKENLAAENIKFKVVLDDGSESPYVYSQKKQVQRPSLSKDEVISQISLNRIKLELNHLSSDDFNGRLAGTSGNDRAATYLIDELREAGINPAINGGYKQSFRFSKGSLRAVTTSNIVGEIKGKGPLSDRYVVIGAHMDHAGTLQKGYTCSPGARDGKSQPSICNGADDNASGTVAVLEAARALAKLKHSLNRSVLIIFFSAEEQGLLGSWHFVKNPVVGLSNIDYMMNLDMVGYKKSFGNTLGALGGLTSKTAARVLSGLSSKYSRSIRVTASAGGGSDHVPFMSKGIPGVFFHTGVDNNRNYHRTSDSSEKIDFSGIELAAKVAFELGYEMSRSSQSSLLLTVDRKPLITLEEQGQSCHDLHENPYIKELSRSFEAPLKLSIEEEYGLN